MSFKLGLMHPHSSSKTMRLKSTPPRKIQTLSGNNTAQRRKTASKKYQFAALIKKAYRKAALDKIQESLRHSKRAYNTFEGKTIAHNYLLSAYLLSKLGEDQKAEHVLKTLIVTGQASASVSALLARVYFAQNKCDLAIQSLQSIQGYQKSYGLLLLAADIKRKLKQYGDAGVLYQRLVLLRPADRRAYLNYAKNLALQSKFQDASRLLDQAQNKFPQDGVVLLVRASILRKQGQLHKAEECYEDCLLASHNLKQVARRRAVRQLCQVKLMQGDVYGAIKFIELHDPVGLIYNSHRTLLQGIAYALKRQYRQAIITLEAPATQPEALAQLRVAVLSFCKIHIKKEAKALILIRSISRKNQCNLYNEQLLQGLFCYRTLRTEAAYLHFHKASQVFPLLPQPHLFMALCKLHQLQCDLQSKQVFTHMQVCSNSESEFGPGFYLAALLSTESFDFELAQEYLHKLSKLAFSSELTNQLKALIYLQMGNILEARKCIDKVDLDHYSFAFNTQLFILAFQGRKETAIANLTKRIMKKGSHPDLHEIVGDLSYLANKYQDALAAYKFSSGVIASLSLSIKQAKSLLSLCRFQQAIQILSPYKNQNKVGSDINTIKLLQNLVNQSKYPFKNQVQGGYIFKKVDNQLLLAIYYLKENQPLLAGFLLQRIVDKDNQNYLLEELLFLQLVFCAIISDQQKRLQIERTLQNCLCQETQAQTQTLKYKLVRQPGGIEVPIRVGFQCFYARVQVAGKGRAMRLLDKQGVFARMKYIGITSPQPPWVRRSGNCVLFTSQQMLVDDNTIF